MCLQRLFNVFAVSCISALFCKASEHLGESHWCKFDNSSCFLKYFNHLNKTHFNIHFQYTIFSGMVWFYFLKQREAPRNGSACQWREEMNKTSNLPLSTLPRILPCRSKFSEKVLETSDSTEKRFCCWYNCQDFSIKRKEIILSEQKVSLMKLPLLEIQFLPFSEQFVMETSCSCLLIDTFLISRVFSSFFE